MSRIGNLPVEIPEKVKIEFSHGTLKVEGPKGKLEQAVKDGIDFELQKSIAIVKRENETKNLRALHGLYRQLLSNMVTGVSQGFAKTLLINGVGYRAEVQGDELILNLGYSNPVVYIIPEDIKIEVEGNNKVNVSGIDRQKVGQVSAEIRAIRPPEPYKGKGVKYENEVVRRKIGKAGVK